MMKKRKYFAGGVDYDPEFRGICPKCGKIKVPVYSDRPWQDGCKLRYHECPSCGTTFKTTQTRGVAPSMAYA